MFIQIENTPNPLSLKFIPGFEIIKADEQCSFTYNSDLSVSPLAKKLLEIDGISEIFFGLDFITVTKNDESDWIILKPSLLNTMMEHFINNLPVIITSKDNEKNNFLNDPISLQIQEIIDTRVRPAVARDGGDITFESFEDGIVYLRMKGACAGCPSATATLKSGIENMLRFYVPEVKEVQQTNV